MEIQNQMENVYETTKVRCQFEYNSMFEVNSNVNCVCCRFNLQLFKFEVNYQTIEMNKKFSSR